MVQALRPDDQRWNNNIAYHRVVLDHLPAGARRALDVGCGEGLLTRRLAALVPEVSGLDLDPASLALACQQRGLKRIGYVLGDLLQAPFEPGTFDLVATVACLHHLDEERALASLAGLVARGGVLVVIGLARSRLPADLPREAAAAIAYRWIRRNKQEWQSPAPVVWPPPHTYRQVEELSARILPGRRFRRHLFWRYSIVWQRPA